ncbi:F0F1-type ATP synthase epsilon subunit [Candidatus Babela massiliensis]|uniref:F0F1-type ATP synthase epsilon subunit n=1 Tax=Candidatus Babela massiliensis TaxID=673862 RepID=V6DGP2_9BACT|nr:F0F1-type ATP synthase epsilon subunit [Candidatus Babela massiliensis]CDK30767.1 F0F1-type ATP synthase epsilon subunit [Candidatus Babela massiliensis]
MKFILISPTKSKEMDVEWIEVQTQESNFVIKKGHAPIIVILAPNKELSLGLQDGSTTIMTVAGGILEVNRNTATLLLTNE